MRSCDILRISEKVLVDWGGASGELHNPFQFIAFPSLTSASTSVKNPVILNGKPEGAQWENGSNSERKNMINSIVFLML